VSELTIFSQGALLSLPLATTLTIISILAVWLPNSAIWRGCYVIAVGVGFYTLAFSLWSLLSIFVLLALLWAYVQKNRFSLSALSGIIVLGVLLGLHILPGFNNYQHLAAAVLNDRSLPFSIWFNYDKSLFAILVLGLVFHSSLIRCWAEFRGMMISLLPILAIGLPAVYCLGVLLGYSVIDWTPSLLFVPWAIKNLFFTVIAEELMFRGLIQRELAAYLPGERGENLSVLIAAVLFGAAHFAGGFSYVLLSTLAGCLYGYAYKVTGRIEAPIITHFLLNAGHFLFFSYPALIPTP